MPATKGLRRVKDIVRVFMSIKYILINSKIIERFVQNFFIFIVMYVQQYKIHNKSLLQNYNSFIHYTIINIVI